LSHCAIGRGKRAEVTPMVNTITSHGIGADSVYTATNAAALTLLGDDTVSLWSSGGVVTCAAQGVGGDSIIGGNGAYSITLGGGEDTVSVGNGNCTILSGTNAGEPVDQQIMVGGIQGFADLADASNTVSLMATGRVSEYLHWAALLDASTGSLVVPGAQATLPQIAEMQAVFAHSSGSLAELNYDANPSSYFSGLFTSDYTKLGFHPANADVNMFDLWTQTGGVAAWDAYVDQARDHGMQSVAPIYSPNGVPGTFSWADAQFDPIRAMALYGGAIGIDAPPSFFFVQSAQYQQFIVDEIKWGVANGLRVSVIVSPYTGNSTYLADTQSYVQMLVAAGAVPTQWVAENYDVNVPATYPNRLGSEDQVNTVDNVALWLARNAPTVAQPVTGGNVITVGNGNDRVTLAAADTLVAGSGADTVSSGGDASISIGGGSGHLALAVGDGVSVSSGRYSVALGAGDSISASGGSLTVQGASGGVTQGLGATDFMTLGKGYASVVGGEQPLSISGGAGVVVATLGAGGGTVQGGSGGANRLVAGAGAATILGGAAGDTITGGSGAVSITTALAGGAQVVLGSGAATVLLNPGDTLFGGAGSATVSAVNDDTIVYGTGSMGMSFGSGNLIVVGGNLNTAVAVASGDNTISGAGGTGNVIFTGGSGACVLRAGNGNDVLSLGSGGGQEWAGAGNATLNGGSGSVIMVGGSGNTFFSAQQANVNILAGSGQGSIVLGSGSALVQLQGGADSVALGSGAVTVSGGSGVDVFDLTGASGTRDVLRNFKLGVDVLRLENGVTLQSERFVGGAAVLRLSDGASVAISGVLIDAAHMPVVAHY
jgi:Ca2+-binding RTX toxin-like protein